MVAAERDHFLNPLPEPRAARPLRAGGIRFPFPGDGLSALSYVGQPESGRPDTSSLERSIEMPGAAAATNRAPGLTRKFPGVLTRMNFRVNEGGFHGRP